MCEQNQGTSLPAVDSMGRDRHLKFVSLTMFISQG